MMKNYPSYKIISPFAAIYALCLFIPTIDATATMTLTLFSTTLKFGIGVFIFPAIYPLSDSMTEVYGKKVSYYISASCYVFIVIFSLLNNTLLAHSDNHTLYHFIIDPSLKVTLAGTFSYIITSFINTAFLYKLKIKMRSTHFIFRSFLCSVISGFIMSLIVQGALYYQYNFEVFMKMFLTIVLMKTLITIPYIYLAKFLVFLYRYVDKIDLEHYNKNLIPI